MLLSLRNDHKEHLSLLISQSTQVVVDFCKLSIDFLHNGPNNKLYKSAAHKLEVETEVVQNCVHGLVNLLLLSCKHKLSEADFRDSVLTLGFNNEQQIVLNEFYKTKSAEIESALEKLAVKEDHYMNLEWRFEVQVASRSLPHQVTPLIALDLSLQSQNQNESRNILLQTDTTNLSHITTKLKAALAESRTSYSRKLQNTFLETSK